MIIKDENGKLLGSIEFSKEEMEKVNENTFKDYAKICIENMAIINDRNKLHIENKLRIDKENEAKLHELQLKHEREIAAEKMKCDQELEAEKMKNEQELAVEKMKNEQELAAKKMKCDQERDAEKMRFEANVEEGKRKTQNIINIISAVVETTKYGINEFTTLYEKYHVKPQQQNQKSNNSQ